MTATLKSVVRCAVYTRKSSEEGLEQSFNSLDAQREACEAFILSQRHEGWCVLPISYDDGGYSGGNMQRPAFQQLLADVAANKIDTIVVYKVDRLTRSLADFAKTIEVLDARGVSFVSVTQQFNTTTSMGRLTLNILLSFAQFEREVTGERIRDKIAASKRRGMWMGGPVPVGYNVKDRKLISNPEEAKTVVKIFTLYLETGCVRELKGRLDNEGLRSKVRTRAGKLSGGSSFSRGALYKILNNRIYLGEIGHKGQFHPGEHEAIISRELWDQVQTQLRDDNQGRRSGLRVESPSLLTGLIFDGEGNKLTPSHAVKNGRRYRYYCQAVTQQGIGKGSSIRIPAHDIEGRVLARIAEFLQLEKEVMDQLGAAEETAESIQQLLRSAVDTSLILNAGTRNQGSEVIRQVVHRVVVQAECVQILLKRKDLRRILLKEGPQDQVSGHIISLEFAARLARRGREIRLVVSPGAEKAPGYQSRALLKAVARAHDWREQLIIGQASGLQAIAKQTGLDESYVRRIFGLAFLAPDIVESILDGRQPHDLTLEKLRTRLPITWAEQRRTILPICIN